MPAEGEKEAHRFEGGDVSLRTIIGDRTDEKGGRGSVILSGDS